MGPTKIFILGIKKSVLWIVEIIQLAQKYSNMISLNYARLLIVKMVFFLKKIP